MHPYLANVRQRLFIQAAITAIFALLPGMGSFQVLTLGLGAVTAGVGVALPSLRDKAYQVVLGWEILAVLIGGYSLTQGVYIPGTIVGIALLIRLFDASTRASFEAATSPRPVMAPGYPAAGPVPGQYGAPVNPQFGAPPAQYGAPVNPQFGAPPAQYAAPPAAPPVGQQAGYGLTPPAPSHAQWAPAPGTIPPPPPAPPAG